MKFLIYIIILFAYLSAGAFAQECWTIDRSRPEWSESDTLSTAPEHYPPPGWKFDVSPNPISGTAQIKCELPSPATLLIEIIDTEGRKVKQIFEGALEPGSHSIVFDRLTPGGALAAGVYFVSVKRSGSIISSIKIAIN